METWESEMVRIEATIRRSDDDGLRARWESGRYMLTLRGGRKQLPKGMLDRMAETLEAGRSDLGARMKFAEKYPSEDELSDAVRKFKTWHEVVHRGLKDAPVTVDDDQGPQETDASTDDEPVASEAERRRARRSLKQLFETAENIDPTALDRGDLDLLAQILSTVQQLQDVVVSRIVEVAA